MSPKLTVKRFGKLFFIAFAIAVLLPCIIMLTMILYCQVPAVPRFKTAIANADRIVVRTGPVSGFASEPENQPVLATVTNAADIAAFNHLFRFHYSLSGFGTCMCCGYPYVDWFRGDEWVETAAIKHGQAVAFDFGDMPLTVDAAVELRQWFNDHGIDPLTPPRPETPDEEPLTSNL